MIKINIIFDKNKRSKKIKNILKKKIKLINNNKPFLIIVIGGDGFMLKTLKKNKNSLNMFYGINSEIMVFDE